MMKIKDPIYREDAIKAINLKATIPHDIASAHYANMAINAIRSVPSADRPQGEWVRDDDYHRCSNCHCVAPLDGDEYWMRDKIREDLTEICPNCGARMKGASDGHTG